MEKQKLLDWPEHFPELCPPDSSREPKEKVYRFVKQNPPSENDFISHRLLYADKVFSDECRACGLSVFTEMADVLSMRKRYNALRKKLLAVGNLSSDVGKILSTPGKYAKSHHTWWVPSGVEVSTIFKIKSFVE
jgi:hypothetical protein